ncbi:hypothetical protein [Methanoculleus sp. 7T]|uniref:hypothetical protein n=1 Tax=Methanoculleus sp. 7T TaxID=2937282 RepID=UPI0020C107E4|nr:hypothetical protein [Methanoculleus sp. 7T]MCK8518378.1 hypothetical protein [Methanoculleus sp. 7T]
MTRFDDILLHARFAGSRKELHTIDGEGNPFLDLPQNNSKVTEYRGITVHGVI